MYTIYYTKDPTLPLDEWPQIQSRYPVNMRLPNMTDDQVYYLRVRIVPPDREWSVITAPTQVITPSKQFRAFTKFTQSMIFKIPDYLDHS